MGGASQPAVAPAQADPDGVSTADVAARRDPASPTDDGQDRASPALGSVWFELRADGTSGDVYCGLFTRDSWPTAPIDYVRVSATADPLVCRFPEVPPGEYAIAAFHDANANRDLDRNWVGLPTEAWALSRGARPTAVPPDFDSINFTHGKETTRLKGRLR
jgi:uncharacterized protein (DUF2141 family)